MGSVAWLVFFTLIIGISGGYLLFTLSRSAGPAPVATSQDPAITWQSRLLTNPQDLEALLGLAHVRLDQGMLDEAESLYRQVLALQPKNVEAISHLGTVQLGRGQTDAALRQYDAALAIDSGYIHALWDKASVLQRVVQDYPAAIRVWEEFRRLVGPDSQDGKTAQQFIAQAREALEKTPPVEKAFRGKS
jgi:tetratricopeptide (TPR) repeat protein